jgi:sec-independent protein translocase protein TatB
VLDIGVTKLALIGGIALVVIGPERLPGVARTLGTLIGRAQRYVSDVKAEVNRSMELDALKKMHETVQSTAREVEQSLQSQVRDLEAEWGSPASNTAATASLPTQHLDVPIYKHPGKNWRLKRGAIPQWYKANAGVRTKAQSGAARVARFRPRRTS